MRTIDGKELNRDGLMPLLEQFKGNRDAFLNFAISNVYYINPIKVANKWLEIKDQIDTTGRGVVRHTNTIFKVGKEQSKKEYVKLLLNDGETELFVIADKDGSTEVRKLFKELTGVHSSNGNKSNVINYTLTHIWGLTGNPYTFIAPWNIALTSTFIAPLTDGKPESNHIRHLFQSTFRAVAWLIYTNVDNWKVRIPTDLCPVKEYLVIAENLLNSGAINILE